VIRDVSEGNERGHHPPGLAGGRRVVRHRGGLAWVAVPVSARSMALAGREGSITVAKGENNGSKRSATDC
jgi:hypothetical protein